MSLVPSQYPNHAVEIQVTVLVPVTDENLHEVDGGTLEALNASGLTWWLDKVAVFKDHRQETMLEFNRPPEFVRHRPKRVRLRGES